MPPTHVKEISKHSLSLLVFTHAIFFPVSQTKQNNNNNNNNINNRLIIIKSKRLSFLFLLLFVFRFVVSHSNKCFFFFFTAERVKVHVGNIIQLHVYVSVASVS